MQKKRLLKRSWERFPRKGQNSEIFGTKYVICWSVTSLTVRSRVFIFVWHQFGGATVIAQINLCLFINKTYINIS